MTSSRQDTEIIQSVQKIDMKNGSEEVEKIEERKSTRGNLILEKFLLNIVNESIRII